MNSYQNDVSSWLGGRGFRLGDDPGVDRFGQHWRVTRDLTQRALCRHKLRRKRTFWPGITFGQPSFGSYQPISESERLLMLDVLAMQGLPGFLKPDHAS